jgi:hypothetical protein
MIDMHLAPSRCQASYKDEGVNLAQASYSGGVLAKIVNTAD